MKNKTYTEAEISDIISQAVHLQAIEGTIGQEGLTLEEIKQVAAEAGIAPQFIEIASSASANHKKAFLTIPTAISRSVFVNGELTNEAWDKMVHQFVRAFGGPGETRVQPQKRSWTRDNTRFTAEQVGDQFVLHAEADWSKELEIPIAFTIVGAIAAVMLSLVGLLAAEWGIGLIALVFGIAVAGFFSTFRSRRVNRLNEMTQRFEMTLNRCIVLAQGTTEQLSPQDAAPLLDGLDDHVAGDANMHSNRRVRS